jgi:hypothetical protein
VKSTYTSNELFHFVGRRSPDDDEANYQILLKVLRKGSVSHPPHGRDRGIVSHNIDFTKRLIAGELLVSTITCYCDIPVDHLPLHVKKYGRFGLSFTRDFLIRYGARPVSYFPYSQSDAGDALGGRLLLSDIEVVFRAFHHNVLNHRVKGRIPTRAISEPPKTPEATLAALDNVLVEHFLAFIKPFDADLPDDHPENYYLEREWRKFGNLIFKPEDVSRVVLASGFEDRLQVDAPGYAMVSVFGI